MSSTSSVISTPDRNTQTRRRRRRAGLVLLLLAALYCALALPWTQRTFGPPPGSDDRTAALLLGELVAETVEAIQLESESPDHQQYADTFAQLAEGEDTLAYLRLWSPTGELQCEVSRDLTVPRAGNGGTLPPLGMPEALAPLRDAMADEHWTLNLASLQSLLLAQQDVTALLEEARARGEAGPKAVSSALVRQDDLLKQVELLRDDGLPLADAATQMDAVLTALTGTGTAVFDRALPTSAAAENEIIVALARHRARLGTVPELPTALAKAEPGAHWPFLRGTRVLVPLYQPADTEVMVGHTGYLELGLYARPLAPMLAAAAIPGALLFLISLILLISARPPRRREEEE